MPAVDPVPVFTPTPEARSKELHDQFRNAMLPEKLRQVACVVCSELKLFHSHGELAPGNGQGPITSVAQFAHLAKDLLDMDDNHIPPPPPRESPAWPEELRKMCLDAEGFVRDMRDGQVTQVRLCKKCFNALKDKKVAPRFALCKYWRGVDPEVLKDRTPAEWSACSLSLSLSTIVRLAMSPDGTQQRGYKGHMISFVAEPGKIVTSLPHEPSAVGLCTHAIVTGPRAAITAGMRDLKIKLGDFLRVEPQKLRPALEWLCKNNPLYLNVAINAVAMGAYAVDGNTLLNDSIILRESDLAAAEAVGEDVHAHSGDEAADAADAAEPVEPAVDAPDVPAAPPARVDPENVAPRIVLASLNDDGPLLLERTGAFDGVGQAVSSELRAQVASERYFRSVEPPRQSDILAADVRLRGVDASTAERFQELFAYEHDQ